MGGRAFWGIAAGMVGALAVVSCAHEATPRGARKAQPVAPAGKPAAVHVPAADPALAVQVPAESRPREEREHAGRRDVGPMPEQKRVRGTLGRGYAESRVRPPSFKGAAVAAAALRAGGGAGFGASQPLTVVQRPAAQLNREGYDHVAERGFQLVRDAPLSTFSIDVDTASYSNVRRFLREGRLPPADAVRIEELVNYFTYAYPKPEPGDVLSLQSEVAPCPWNPQHALVQVKLSAQDLAQERVPPRNLVFLVDVSGSMQAPDKLPLLKRGLSLLARDLRAQDRVSMVVYAGAAGVVLPSTSGRERGRVLAALAELEAGGTTNGASGIELAYREAQRNFVEGGVNRVLLATDGDFNVGPSSEGELTRLIEHERERGIFLTVLGFGTGNLQDARMEQLADHGNGNYAYIDSLQEAHKVLVREAGATLVTLAKDVKLQVELNPKWVHSYRLVGYENRALAARDFNDDTKDAGEIGAGHTVTALYELTMRASGDGGASEVDPLRYQSARSPSSAAGSDELMTVKVRYKAPDASHSRLLRLPIKRPPQLALRTSSDFQFAAAVAEFGLLLRASPHRGEASLGQVESLARTALGADPHGDRAEFLELVQATSRLGLGG